MAVVVDVVTGGAGSGNGGNGGGGEVGALC